MVPNHAAFRPGATVRGLLLPEPIELIAVIPLGASLKLIGRGLRSNRVYDPILEPAQLEQLSASAQQAPFDGDAKLLRLGVEALRLGLAFEYDPYFSLSIARVDPLPHQLEAVYDYFMKLPRIRFLLADDPGAGKTIMAGLLLKEMKARGLVRRTLIVTPANLSFQWQRELRDKFREQFKVIRSSELRSNYGVNPWQEEDQLVTSVSWVSRVDDARDSLFRSRWDLVIVDEAQPHGTEFRWYIRYFYDDPNPQNPDITKFDPGDDAAPTDDEAYYLQWFTHFNPYIHGLPEMLESYGGVNVRHGTDFYQFDGGETVQPELINMARFVLSWIGGDCCTGEYDTCAETDDRSDAFHHNPRFRGGDHGMCCVPMPIKFRWSGSNQHPHYMTGGKGLVGGSTPDPRPLHNHPNHMPGQGEAWGSAAARKTWRGINMLYTDDLHFDNPFYGGGYSWGTAPGTFILMYKPNHDELAKVYAKYPEWGLRPGDVIEAVHIKEIVDAVDYLIDYGVWTSINICTRKRTPGQYMGKDCGYHYALNYVDCFGTSGAEWRIGCDKCCANAEACWPYNHVLGYWYHQWGPGYDDQYTEYPDTCETWPTPTWEECTQNCGSAKCHMMSRKSGYSQYSPESSPECPCERGYWEDTVCDGYDPLGQFGGEASPGCGYHRDEKGCKSWDWKLEQCVDDPHAGFNCVRRVEGYSYFACTPDECNAGWDDQHGGLFKKNRLDHEWCHQTPQGQDCSGLYFKATGPPGNEFSGNCLGDMYGCGTLYPLGPDSGLWFHEVTGVYWEGLVPSWYPGCNGMPGCSSDCSFGDTLALPPEIPGYGYHGANGEPLCAQYVDAVSGCFSAWAGSACCTGHICHCSLGNFPACKGEAAWVAVDLNLDGSGKPYRNFPGRNGDLPPYTGRGVPRLRDYDLTKDPATWMHDCPCETWTGAGQCVI